MSNEKESPLSIGDEWTASESLIDVLTAPTPEGACPATLGAVRDALCALAPKNN